jgi:hypothetical protein
VLSELCFFLVFYWSRAYHVRVTKLGCLPRNRARGRQYVIDRTDPFVSHDVFLCISTRRRAGCVVNCKLSAPSLIFFQKNFLHFLRWILSHNKFSALTNSWIVHWMSLVQSWWVHPGITLLTQWWIDGVQCIKILTNWSEELLEVRKWTGQQFSERFYWHDCSTMIGVLISSNFWACNWNWN